MINGMSALFKANGQVADIILNLIVTVQEMKKASSKSTFSKKNKTLTYAPESKKSSRIIKANSCVKINSINSEHNSRQNPLSQTISLKQNGSQRQILPYQLPHVSRIYEKPVSSNRPTLRAEAKSSIQTIPMRQNKQQSIDNSSVVIRLKQKNEDLNKQNGILKQRCCDLQEMSLRDKQKIKNLIIRINEVKQSNTQASQMKHSHPSTTPLIFNQHQISAAKLHSKHKMQTPYKNISSLCESRDCMQRKKYLESELYRERILRDKLEADKREWEYNKQQLKQQYNELLLEIQDMREKQY